MNGGAEQDIHLDWDRDIFDNVDGSLGQVNRLTESCEEHISDIGRAIYSIDACYRLAGHPILRTLDSGKGMAGVCIVSTEGCNTHSSSTSKSGSKQNTIDGLKASENPPAEPASESSEELIGQLLYCMDSTRLSEDMMLTATDVDCEHAQSACTDSTSATGAQAEGGEEKEAADVGDGERVLNPSASDNHCNRDPDEDAVNSPSTALATSLGEAQADFELKSADCMSELRDILPEGFPQRSRVSRLSLDPAIMHSTNDCAASSLDSGNVQSGQQRALPKPYLRSQSDLGLIKPGTGSPIVSGHTVNSAICCLSFLHISACKR